jgi:hypothetical protein
VFFQESSEFRIGFIVPLFSDRWPELFSCVLYLWLLSRTAKLASF